MGWSGCFHRPTGFAAVENGEAPFATVWSSRSGVLEKVSFRSLEERINSRVASLVRAGLSPGGRWGTVGMLDKGSLGFYLDMLAIQALGGAPAVLNWRQPTEVLVGCLSDAGCSALLVGRAFSESGVARALAEAVPLTIDSSSLSTECSQAPTCAGVGHGPSVAVHRVSDSCSSLESDSSPVSECGVRPLVVFFTTGSTGRPKPVVHTGATLEWTARNFPFEEGARSTLCMLPNFHVLMTVQNFLVPLARGIGAVVLEDAPPATADVVLRACADLAPSTLDTVPFVLEEMADLPASALAPLRGVLVRSGGAPLAPGVAFALAQAGLRLGQHYGQTEAPGMQLVTVPGAAPDELDVMHLPPPVIRTGGVPPHGQENHDREKSRFDGVSLDLDGETGELLLRTGASSPGYLDGPKMRPGRLRDGAHRTGDVFEWTSTRSGFRGLRFVRRLDDVLVLATGELVDPRPIEAALASELDVPAASLVVVGRARHRPCALVEASASVSARLNPSALAQAKDRVDAVSAATARLGRVLVLRKDVDPALPRSVKGAVVRPEAEALFDHLLVSRGQDLADSERDENNSLGTTKSYSEAACSSACGLSLPPWGGGGGGAPERAASRKRERAARRLLEQGATPADLVTTIPGLDSLEAVRLARRYQQEKDAPVDGSEEKRSPIDTFKRWLCPWYHPVAGRSLASIALVNLGIKWYGLTGAYDGMDCILDWNLGPEPAMPRVQTILLSRKLPSGRRLSVRVWHPTWKKSTAKRRSTPSPCVVCVNGDAFYGTATTPPLILRLVELGFVVAQPGRRGSHQGGAFPNALADVAAAVRAVKRSARDLGVDPDRVGIFGDSSGGWFAAMIGALSGETTAAVAADLGLRDDGEKRAPDDRDASVACVVCLYPPTNFATLDSDMALLGPWLLTFPSEHPDSHVSLFLGGTPSDYPDRAARAAPATYLKKRSTPPPPFFLAHGTADPCISCIQSRVFLEHLRAAPGDSLRHQYLEVPGAGHGTYHFSQAHFQAKILAFLQLHLDPLLPLAQ